MCPIVERVFGGSLDVVTPYGFGGFAGRGLGPTVLEGWRDFAERARIRVRLPGPQPGVGRTCRMGDGQAESQNEVFLLDLRPSEDEMFKALSTNRKRNVSCWRKMGDRRSSRIANDS